MNVTFDQREVGLVGKNGIVFVGNGQRFVVPAEVVEVVGEVDGSVAILRQLLQDLVAELR